MRVCLLIVFLAGLAAVPALGQEKKEVVLKGKITCAKCELKLANRCSTVVVVKKGDKDVVYYFDEKSHRAHHRAVCQGAKKGSVTGTVTKKGDKYYISVRKISFD
ncbi:MAG: hypothetical protein KatS3mg105_2468 [Gemmatales bacterium]|nr:MAG: hypothetical protein KatS3mg105_2468 [Gemmatales bacterium]